MAKKYRIYIFRHGETEFNLDKRFTGFKNAKLAPEGIRHAKTIAEKLKNKKFQIAFQTRLSRSKDTLKEVLRFHPECYAIIEDDRIIERSYGKLEGKTHNETIKKYGQKKFDSWHRGFRERPPGGESFSDVEKRVKRFIEDLIALIKKERVNVAVSAHGNSIRLFRKIIERASEKEACSWFIPYDKVFEYKIPAGK